MVDGTMLTALSAIATEQATPTKSTLKKVAQFLDCAAAHPDAVLTFSRSDVALQVESDASHSSERNARSRAGGHFCLSEDTSSPKNNGAALNVSQVIKAVSRSEKKRAQTLGAD